MTTQPCIGRFTTRPGFQPSAAGMRHDVIRPWSNAKQAVETEHRTRGDPMI